MKRQTKSGRMQDALGWTVGMGLAVMACVAAHHLGAAPSSKEAAIPARVEVAAAAHSPAGLVGRRLVRADYANVADGHRWQHFPVTVAMNGSWAGHNNYRRAALAGMRKWVTATDGRVQFKFVNRAANADITLRLRYGSKDGYTRIATWGTWMKRGEITLGTLTLSSHVISLSNFQADAVHEFGHALGIIEHSPSPGDIMYPIMDNQIEISPRDRATFYKVYGWPTGRKGTN